MVKQLSLIALLLCMPLNIVFATDADEQKENVVTLEDENGEAIDFDLSAYLDSMTNALDSINKSFTFIPAGEKVDLADGVAILNIPEGYKYLDKKQSETVLEDLWGNLHQDGCVGMLFVDTTEVTGEMPYAIEITYDAIGYVEDDDAEDIDYDDLLVDMQKGTEAQNEKRAELGYPTMEIIGWASAPFYDKENHILHWAKEIAIQDYEVNTLNYDIRKLGRKGILSMNFIAETPSLEIIKNDIPKISQSAIFNGGYAYGDFNPDLDDVAAVGLAGLIAGKALAKGGFFVMLAKFWKVIAIGVVSVFGFLFGRNRKEA